MMHIRKEPIAGPKPSLPSDMFRTHWRWEKGGLSGCGQRMARLHHVLSRLRVVVIFGPPRGVPH